MPIYEYVCSACANRAEILHGINDSGPAFCPACGAEGTLRKGFAPPAIVFKGSGWAKKDRSSGSRTKAAAKGESPDGGSSDGSSDGKAKEGSSSGTPAGTRESNAGGDAKPAASGAGSGSGSGSGSSD